MKNIYTLLIATCTVVACSQKSTDTTITGNYGNTEWSDANAIASNQLINELAGQDSLFVTVSGEINKVCQAKGCWMSMNAGEEELFIKFKDYGFFVPMNSASHKATMQGWAFVDTLTVSDLQEKAKDSEATPEEIAAITEPEVKLSFVADGVIIE